MSKDVAHRLRRPPTRVLGGGHPDYILEPRRQVLNKDLDVHKKALKPSPVANGLVNRCIECGFCESYCPSRDIALTPARCSNKAVCHSSNRRRGWEWGWAWARAWAWAQA